jgi:hypothetical protein
VAATAGGKARCGTEMVEMFRKAGTAGFDVGSLRAGEVLLARFSGPLIDAASGAGCPQGAAAGGSPPPVGLDTTFHRVAVVRQNTVQLMTASVVVHVKPV